ncbi:MAG: DUF2007 domain-containing protein [Bacteroidetes bacterium]|jgi:Putative prokaryotic signal transducing protein|nr:DUF2007 domain-containing protein [Bacteroidota bacterium]
MSWEKIFSTRVFAEASIIEGLLADNDVPVQLLNKQDSSYPMFGDIQLYVPQDMVVFARQLIDQQSEHLDFTV